MKINEMQLTIKEAAKQSIIIGLIQDRMQILRALHNWEKIAELKKVLRGFRNYSLHYYGEAGIGKTQGVIQAATDVKLTGKEIWELLTKVIKDDAILGLFENVLSLEDIHGVPCVVQYASQWADSADAVGMPKVVVRNGREITENIVRDFFPQLKRDNEGNVSTRHDGGLMVDYESLAPYIRNYEELMVQYKGDINQAPGCIYFWDEPNRVTAQDVFQLLFDVFLSRKLGSYAFPNATLMVAASNPNTGEYNVAGHFEEKAFKDRFVHNEVEADASGYQDYMNWADFDWSVRQLVSQHPETVQVKSDEDYDLNITPSGRSVEVLNAIKKFSFMYEKFGEGLYTEFVAGAIGRDYAIHHVDIINNGSEIPPTGEEIITDYQKVRSAVQQAKEANRQDFMNIVKDNFIGEIVKDGSMVKYGIKPTEKDEGKKYVIPANLDNVYQFFLDLDAEFRMAILKHLIDIGKKEFHAAISLYPAFVTLVATDTENSRK